MITLIRCNHHFHMSTMTNAEHLLVLAYIYAVIRYFTVTIGLQRQIVCIGSAFGKHHGKCSISIDITEQIPAIFQHLVCDIHFVKCHLIYMIAVIRREIDVGR